MSAKCLAGALIVLLLASTGWAATALLPIVTHDGRPYVELTRVAASMQSKGSPPAKVVATPASTRAQLRAGSQVVTLTRNWSQVLVNGKPVVLDAPVRVKRGVWLVPESFVGRIRADPGGERGAGPDERALRGRAARGQPGGRAGQIVSVVHAHRRRDVVGRHASHRVERTQGSAGAARRPRKRRAQSGRSVTG